MVEQNNQFNFIASKLKNIEDNQSLNTNVITNIQSSIKDNNINENVNKLDEIKSNLNSN